VAWRRLEAETGRTIVHLTGQVDMGPEEVLAPIAGAMAAEGVAVRRLDAAGVSETFPELHLSAGEEALFHASGGTVLAPEAIAALSEAAARAGAALSAPEPVVRIELGAAEALVATPARELRAGRVVVAAGPWSGGLLAELGVVLPLSPAVAQVTYVDVPAFVGRPGIAEWSVDADGRGVYGHPVPGVGYKFAFDAAGAEQWSPSAGEWPPDGAEQAELEEWIARRFPETAAPVIESQRHPWTMTPDADFVIDVDGPLVVACGCSGHAFKFGPALGELVADVALGAAPPDAAMFSKQRAAMLQAPVSGSTPISR
jgi:sarcosine oxidase